MFYVYFAWLLCFLMSGYGDSAYCECRGCSTFCPVAVVLCSCQVMVMVHTVNPLIVLYFAGLLYRFTFCVVIVMVHTVGAKLQKSIRK